MIPSGEFPPPSSETFIFKPSCVSSGITIVLFSAAGVVSLCLGLSIRFEAILIKHKNIRIDIKKYVIDFLIFDILKILL